MPSSRRSRDRSQDSPQPPSRASRRRKSPKSGPLKDAVELSQKPVVSRRPLLDLCERSGWSVQFLNRRPTTGEDLADLCVRELIACREAGQFTLAVALADAALKSGLHSPRIIANRSRALRSQARALKGTKRTFVSTTSLRNRLKRLFSLRKPKHEKGKTAPPAASVLKSESLDVNDALKALRRRCQSEGWTPKFLDASASADVGLACAKEMQRCRLEGRHDLVVALGAEAALHNLDHPRIKDNLKRSQGKAQLKTLRAMVNGDMAALLSAEVLLLEALIDNPGHQEFRELLGECIARQFERHSGTPLQPELRQSAVNLELNTRLLRAIQHRRSVGATQT